MEGHRRGTPPPPLEDIAGAKHWDNMPDQGFTVHRPYVYKNGRIQTEAIMLHREARFEVLRQAIALPLYTVALVLDAASSALGRLAASIAGGDWPGIAVCRFQEGPRGPGSVGGAAEECRSIPATAWLASAT
jgi:hypothetical protein